jgi:soluble calcium-activated nucleotidase 1
MMHYFRPVLNVIWTHRASNERRAITFIVVFALLVCSWIFTSDSTASQATILYQQMSDRKSWTQLVADVPQYHILAVADNDDKNVGEGHGGDRVSALSEGSLTIRVEHGQPVFHVDWSTTHILRSSYLHDGRGLELSTLQFWMGTRLFSCDDRTGIVYEIIMEEGLLPRLVPRHILPDGDGRSTSGGMRCEWCTTKGDYLMLGSTGHPWIDRTGNAVNRHPLWIKTLSPSGIVKHIDWGVPYEAMRRAMGIGDDGYLIHECGLWSSKLSRWYFIPRHVSNTPYRPGDEHQHGSTAIIVADANFKKIVVNVLQNQASPMSGVTDCKFVPNGRDREIIIVKTDESLPLPPPVKDRNNGRRKSAAAPPLFQSYVSIINTDGVVLMDDVPMPAGWKFEGIELRPIIHSER